MDITFIQTADPIFYYPMLNQTSRTVRQYCIRNGLTYESFVGIKRGTMPWHSAYNRVYMLKEMLDRGINGWVFYMDADAMIIDQDFDVRTYLKHRDHHGAIFSGYCTPDTAYNINSGGFAVNLSHPWGKALVLDYWRAVTAIPDSEYNAALIWEADIPEDQLLLFNILEDYVLNKRCGDQFLFEQVNGGYTNHGPFIAQFLRSKYLTFSDRMKAVREQADNILRGRRDNRGDFGPGIYISAAHPCLYTSCGKKAQSAICSTGSKGRLMYGPYIRLTEGKWIVRVFGEVFPKSGGSVTLISDVVSELGANQWCLDSSLVANETKGILFEHNVDLPRDVASFEVRVEIGAHEDARIHAVHLYKA